MKELIKKLELDGELIEAVTVRGIHGTFERIVNKIIEFTPKIKGTKQAKRFRDDLMFFSTKIKQLAERV